MLRSIRLCFLHGGMAIALLSSPAIAGSSFDELRQATLTRLAAMDQAKSLEVTSDASKVVDCPSGKEVGNALSDNRGRYSQYIYNTTYEWTYVATEKGPCVVLLRPESKALTREEAADLVTASHLEFPVSNVQKTTSLPKKSTRSDKHLEIDLTSKSSKKTN